MALDDLKHVYFEMQDDIAVLHLNRAAKRNAINDGLLEDVEAFFSAPPDGAKVVVMVGEGEHFSAGLDLAEHKERDAREVMLHSQDWHRAFNRIQFGGLPVVAAMHGGVIGGGLEMATACHVRVADASAFYALPEGRRGIFVGGGASVRVGRILGPDRMCEMMLTGRRYDAREGQRLGLSHYLVGNDQHLETALELAKTIAANAPLSNYMMLNAITRIADMSMSDGFFTESLATALTQTSEDARAGMQAFLQRRSASFGPKQDNNEG